MKKTLLLSGIVICLTVAFASAQTNNAFGNNMRIVDSTLVGGNYQYTYAIYSGDINQDGTIDLSDFNALEADVLQFRSGYIITDLNGDGVADLSDFNLLEKNVLSFVETKKP
jgi:hypothetical protein